MLVDDIAECIRQRELTHASRAVHLDVDYISPRSHAMVLTGCYSRDGCTVVVRIMV